MSARPLAAPTRPAVVVPVRARLLAAGVGLVAAVAVALVLLGLSGNQAVDPIAQAATVSATRSDTR